MSCNSALEAVHDEEYADEFEECARKARWHVLLVCLERKRRASTRAGEQEVELRESGDETTS